MNPFPKTAILSGANCLTDLRRFISESSYSSIVVLVDENTQEFCYPLLKLPRYHHLLKVNSGEENKNLANCLEVWKNLSELECDRKTLLINLGGGVLCDMGGFIASTYLRGIDFLNIPTTLLAMCDAGIGGKTGVNFNGLKNQIGVFNDPISIFINVDFLETLPEKQFLSGYAEIIKHALIADKVMFKSISKQDDIKKGIIKQVLHSHKIKLKIVASDAFEKGVRKSLNFGHSIGHALESLFLVNDPQNAIFHGEAVAAGMITEAIISFNRQLLSAGELEMIINVISNWFPKLKISPVDISDIIDYISNDKKNEYNRKLFTLLDGIGHYSINNDVTDDEISQSLEHYLSL